MCGISAIIVKNKKAYDYKNHIHKMLNIQSHRGPDNKDYNILNDQLIFGHNRLAIIDKGPQATQPLFSNDKNYCIIFNGEIYNYIELKKELSLIYEFKSNSDTEVLLAAYIVWKKKCLDKLKGMFAFIIYDKINNEIFICRDRFGVKPLYYSFHNNNIYFASEIKTLHSIGIPKIKNENMWARYFLYGLYQYKNETFWKDIFQLEAGHFSKIKLNRNYFNIKSKCWYNFFERIMNIKNDHTFINQNNNDHLQKYKNLLETSVKLRFRSDVKVGFNISGGLDSSLLLGIVNHLYPSDKINAFTFYCNDKRYDELSWAHEIIKETNKPFNKILLKSSEIKSLFDKVSFYQDEPFGGVPTIAYSKIFEVARRKNIIVLLDGQGIDEAWAGYDYYHNKSVSIVQGVKRSPFIKDVLSNKLISNVEKPVYTLPFDDKLLNMQYRDLFYTKIPRALRFNDRISMMYSTELREPFLDHDLVEYAFSLPLNMKIQNGKTKWALRNIAKSYLKSDIVFSPKRPLQTPQREWLSGSLKNWVNFEILNNIEQHSNWFDKKKVKSNLDKFYNNDFDNSFFIWQWLSLK